ncbi:MAG: hypothetical protein IKL68_05130 [Clostridia bacterium]|nr:hypothetical protein [Clostridia bacterium]
MIHESSGYPIGYSINNGYSVSLTPDGLYIPENYTYVILSPAVGDISDIILAGNSVIEILNLGLADHFRPVVCLNEDIPAKLEGTNGYSLIK